MYKSFINAIKPFHYSQYKSISSNEKLATYACYYLDKNNIPLTFTYICITCFKMFPEKFYFDDEFKEFPHIEKLNRTILHMYTAKTKTLVGSVRLGYKLTPTGFVIAKQVESDILNKEMDTTKQRTEIMDSYKKGTIQDYDKLINTDYYNSYDITSNNFDINFLWNYFHVVPFTQLVYIKKYFEEIKKYAQHNKDKKCELFCAMVINSIKI